MQVKTRFVATALILIALIGTASAETYYADPVNGSMSNDGSYDNPWRTAEEVFAAGLIGTTVQPGDTLLLRDGYHGEINYSNAHNSDYITIAAQQGHNPKLKRIKLTDVSKWIIRGLTIEQTAFSHLVEIASSNSHDVIIEDCNIFSIEDSSGWSVTDWQNLATYCGVKTQGSNITVRNNTIKNLYFGIQGGATNSLIEHNTINYIAEDGMVSGGNYVVIQYNTFKNFLKLSGHPDGIQFHRGKYKTPMYNVTVRGNLIIGKEPGETNPLVKEDPEGIVNFDCPPFNWLVENNVVITEHYWGIGIIGGAGFGAVNSTIINNIVVNPDPNFERSTSKWALISIGSNAQDTVVRNNMSRMIPSPNPSRNIVVDHCIVIDNSNLDDLFLDYQNYDVRHKPGSPAIDAGSPELAPSVDILGTPRPQGAGYDIGAYEFIQELPCTSDSDCDILDNPPCIDYMCDIGDTNNCILSDTDGIPCNDNDACTLNDKCSNGACIGTKKNCNDGIDCTSDVCVDGICQYTPNDSRCGTSMTCATYYCDIALDCQTTYHEGADCQDGIECTEGDSCDSAGNCLPGIANHSRCLEGFPDCTSATCDPTQGCIEYQPEGCNVLSGLVLWMTFNEGSGNTAADSSGNENNGTLLPIGSEPTWQTTGCPSGNCLSFDGVDDYVDCGTSTDFNFGTGDFTIMAWVKSDNTGTMEIVAAGTQFLRTWSEGALMPYISDTDGKLRNPDSSIVITDGNWHHVAVMHDYDTKTQVYIDGVPDAIDTTSFTGAIDSSGTSLYIGTWSTKNRFWNGLIDEVRIYNRALSPEEIQAVYNETTECVDLPALLNYISQWKQGQITMLVLMQKIGKWKSGQGCS